MIKALSLILVCSYTLAADFVGKDLLNYFQSTCTTSGPFTASVLGQAEALVSVLEGVKSDPDCVSVAGNISALNNLQNKILELEAFNSDNIEIEKIKAQEAMINTQIGESTDNPDLQSELFAALRQLQVSRVSLVSQNSSFNRLNGKSVNSLYSRIVQASESTFTSISNNSRCLQKNPQILSSITSLATAVSSGVSAVNPALSIGISAATDFIGTVVEGVRVGGLNRKIRKIMDSSTALEGYRCVMESMSNKWCELKDAKSLVELKAKMRRKKEGASKLSDIIRLNDREIPVVLDWLTSVRAGAPASTEADAGRQNTVIYKEAGLRAAAKKGEGIINEAQRLYNSATTERARWTELRKVILALTSTQCGGGFGNQGSSQSSALSEIYSTDFAPYYLLGLSTIPTEPSSGFISFCSFDALEQWPNAGGFDATLISVTSQFNLWIDQARSNVRREIAIVTQPDPLQTLSLAFESTGNRWKISPVDSFKNISTFLKDFRPSSFTDPAFEKLFNSTQEKIDSIVDDITTALVTEQFSDVTTAIDSISKTAELSYGVIVIQARLEMLVRITTQEYLRTQKDLDEKVVAQLLVADSFIEGLERIGSSTELTDIMLDIQKAEFTAAKNMDHFIDIFGKNINRILEKNFEDIMKSEKNSYLYNTYRATQANLCTLLSSLPNWSSKIDKKFCRGLSLKAIFPDGPKSPKLTDKYLNSSFDKRNCAFRDYRRASKIYQDWGIL